MQAFQAFVVQDFLLAARALNKQAKLANDQLNFKFLKYGTGFFAESLGGEAKNRLLENLARGVLAGVKQLFKLSKEDRSQIKRIELPFYFDYSDQNMMQILKEINTLCQHNGVEFNSTCEDALAQTSKYITATTNCSDPHVPTGNEMGYMSVDAAIAENLQGKGNKFNPILNRKMKAEYLKLDYLSSQELNDDNRRAESSSEQQEMRSSDFWPVSNLRKGEPRSYLPGITWAVIVATVVGLFVKTNQAIRLGVPSSWRATLSVAAAFFVVLEGIFARNTFKDRQYDEYVNKSTMSMSTDEVTAFNAGVKSAEDNRYYYIGSWRSYLLSPGAFYAGLEAQLKKDFQSHVLMYEMKQPRVGNSQ